MVKSVLALFTALIAGWLLVGSTVNASAHYRHAGCCGGSVAPSYVYRTAHEVRHVTRYRDVSRTNYVHRTHRIVHITRVQPVVYVHAVTRIHHHTVSVVHTVYQHVTEKLPTRTYVSHSVTNTYDCVCHRHCR